MKLPQSRQIYVHLIRNLIKKESILKWDMGRQNPTDSHSEPPVLRFFDPNVMAVLECDASMNGLGACLLLNNQPVAYVSRSLKPTELHFNKNEKEMLAIVFGMERFESYL